MSIDYQLGMLRILIYGIMFFSGGCFVAGIEQICICIRKRIKDKLISNGKYDTLPSIVKRHLDS